MGVFCAKNQQAEDITISAELIILGAADTEKEKVLKMREQEDQELDRSIGTHDLLRLLAVKNKLKNQRVKEDRESLVRKQRRAEVKRELKKRESLKAVADSNENELSENEKMSENMLGQERSGTLKITRLSTNSGELGQKSTLSLKSSGSSFVF